MSSDTVLAINATLGKEGSATATGLEAKVRASMKAVLDGNFMEIDDQNLFRAAIGGVLLDIEADSDDSRELMESMQYINRVSVWLTASQAGLEVKPPEPIDDVLPLLAWWHEVKAAQR